MKKMFLLILLGILFTLDVSSQTIIDSEIKDFLCKAEKIEANSQLSIYAYEVISNKEWNKESKNGIYRIGAFIDHSYTHLLFIDGNKKIFVNTYQGNIEVLKKTLSFLQESEYKYTDKEKLSYIQDILYILEGNRDNIPW